MQRQSSPAATASRSLPQRCSWRRRARRRRPRRGVSLRSPRRSPPWCDRRSRRTPARPPCAPGAASASAVRPIRGRDRRTRSSRSRPGRRARRDILPRAAPASRSAAATRDAPPPSPAPAAAPSPRPAAADTAASRVPRRRTRRATASPDPPSGPGSDSCSPPPALRPQAGPDRPLAQSLREPQPQHLTYLPHRQSLARHSRPPLLGKGSGLPLVEDCQQQRPAMSAPDGVHDHRNRCSRSDRNSVFTIDWN